MVAEVSLEGLKKKERKTDFSQVKTRRGKGGKTKELGVTPSSVI